MNDSRRTVVLLFDGDCAFCTKCAHLGQRLRLNCDFVPLQSIDLASLGVDPERTHREVALRHDDGRVLYAHEAIAGALLTGGLAWRALGYALTLGPINRLSALGYRVVSRHRHHFPGGTSACDIDAQ